MNLVEVAVTLPVAGCFHYRVPAHLEARAQIGARVLVRFGPRKVTGVVVRAADVAPEGVSPLDLDEVLDDQPALPHELVELCSWIAEYYEAPPGEVMRAALPAGSNIAARVAVQLTDAGRAALAGEGGALTSKHRDTLAAIASRPKALNGTGRRIVADLRARGLVEDCVQRGRPRARLKQERFVALVDGLDIEAARKALSKARKQRAALDALVAAREVPTRDLSSGIVRALTAQGMVRIVAKDAALTPLASHDALPAGGVVELTPEQAIAVEAITGALGHQGTAGFVPYLLHGVTGSGKTEVYLRSIAVALKRGTTALVLVPEISLTPQLAARFRARFGDEVAILHSGLSEQARLGEWSRLRRGAARIAVGARSAVFAPLEHIGIIVVDEEHDGSFKQDEGVRYHARDVALVRAQRAGAICVLGSATPSLESYAHAVRGAYHLLELTKRPTARPMPNVEIVDLRVHTADGEAMLSGPLRAAIQETLAAGDQIILFLNRRGFATFVLCRACGFAFRCPHCAVSLTYHRASDRLTCHYCGFQQRIPSECTSCRAHDAIVRKGLGTERVAIALAQEFPDARVARLDRDVASGAKIEAVLARVARREIDVLVGTQMVTKGHDFPGVTLVGVLCADTGLNLPDFRASERTFQLLAQVAGRAGRGDRSGRVIVQTYRPLSHAVTAAAMHDYPGFYEVEAAARAELGYPPHGRLIAVRVEGSNAGDVAGTAHRIAQLAETLARRDDNHGVEVRGAVAAPLERLRGRTRWQIWLRSANRIALRRVARAAVAVDVPSSVRVALDVDPLSTL